MFWYLPLGLRKPNDMREIGTEGLEFLGIKINKELNNNCPRGEIADLTAEGASVKTLVIPTDEEYMIALDTERIVKKNKQNKFSNFQKEVSINRVFILKKKEIENYDVSI